MPGIIPVTSAGAVAATSPLVTNGYIPNAAFTFSCPQLYLPSDCTAKILPAQINAFESEMIALAECWDHDFVWNCSVLNNLCSAFTAWVADNAQPHGDGVTISTDAPFSILPDGTVAAICADVSARAALQACLNVVSTNAGNMIVEGTDTLALLTAQQAVDGIQADPVAFCDLMLSLVARIKSGRVNLGGGIALIIPPNTTTPNGFSAPIPLGSAVIDNPDNCLPMHVVVSGDSYFQISSNGAGGGEQQTVFLSGSLNGGPFTLLSTSDPIRSDSVFPNSNHIASHVNIGFLDFIIPPASSATVDFVNFLQTNGAAGGYTNAPALTTQIGGRIRYDFSYLG